MIITKDYLTQMWPIFERQQIIERLAKEHGQDSVLPVRLNGFKEEVPGLSDGIGYLSVSSDEYMVVVENFIKKIMRDGYDIDSTEAYSISLLKLEQGKKGYAFFDNIYTSIGTIEKSISKLTSSEILSFMGDNFYWSKSTRDEPLCLFAENKILDDCKGKGLVEICRLDAPEAWIGCGIWTIFWPENTNDDKEISLLIVLYIYSTKASDISNLRNNDDTDCAFLSGLYFRNDNAERFYKLAKDKYRDIK